MDREDAKRWMADALETLGVCTFVEPYSVSPDLIVKAARRIEVRASRHIGDGCLYVTESQGEWSGYYKPDAKGILHLSSFGFGDAPGRIAMILDTERILAHFANDLGVTNAND